ncbi:lung adenoma susceptibility protein 2 isoform X2 [Antennarius striatus]|uniref:lung adenoma susceptibility protein 2 isoform X2 n=1 Tax=Antennarius striatus TaxID=241820 RepID=UPI0035AEA939
MLFGHIRPGSTAGLDFCRWFRGRMDLRDLSGDFLSPESTVTCLLSSSGYLRSSCSAREPDTTFTYRNKSYESASAALDAYISDFEDTPHTRNPPTERCVSLHGPPPTPSRPRLSIIRNKDVLREHLTDEELDFLNLPGSSLLHSTTRDRLSMTTDELLLIPHDGSMPVTRTSAFLQGHLSRPGPSQLCSSSGSVNKVWDRLGSGHAIPHMVHRHPQSARMYSRPRCRRRPGRAVLKPEDMSSDSCNRSADRTAEPSPLLHLPHWFTSNKTDMDCSGISSVPDLTYPAWVQCCAPSEEPPPSDSELCGDHAPRSRAPSWVAELEDDDPDQGNSQQSLRDLRLQFAEHISLLAPEKRSSDMETILRDNRIESLIQKADQVLNSLAHRSGREASVIDSVAPPGGMKEYTGPADSEELLYSSPSHCHPVNQEVAPAAGGATEVLTDRKTWGQSCHLHGNTILKQPGPVEALKQMLFRLQAVETALQHREHPSPPMSPQREETCCITPEPEVKLRTTPGGASLQRTLHHLSRLKALVEEPREELKVREEEKGEDEGHYSSSSADGLVCYSTHRP